MHFKFKNLATRLTRYTQPVCLLHVFESVDDLSLDKKLDSNFVRNALLNGKSLLLQFVDVARQVEGYFGPVGNDEHEFLD